MTCRYVCPQSLRLAGMQQTCPQRTALLLHCLLLPRMWAMCSITAGCIQLAIILQTYPCQPGSQALINHQEFTRWLLPASTTLYHQGR